MVAGFHNFQQKSQLGMYKLVSKMQFPLKHIIYIIYALIYSIVYEVTFIRSIIDSATVFHIYDLTIFQNIKDSKNTLLKWKII